MLNINDLLQIAIEETVNLEPGEKFLLKDLFKGYEGTVFFVRTDYYWELYF